MRKLLLICLFIVISTAPLWAVGTVCNQNCKVSWEANNPLIDPDLAGYKLYIGTTPGIYTTIKDIGLTTNEAAPFYPLAGFLLSDGQYYIMVTAYDTSGNESAPSNEVPFTMNVKAPDARSGVQISK